MLLDTWFALASGSCLVNIAAKPGRGNVVSSDSQAIKPNLRSEHVAGQHDFVRGLKNRHVQLIAFGGAIGVGLFLGSAGAIQRAGPVALLAYLVAGITVFFVARALGELLLYRPVTGSFATYAEEFLGPWAGFVTGWSYWCLWVLVGIAEITAVGVYVHHWFPDLPQWIPALVTLALLAAVNLNAVRLFGEFEFWFALIKIVTIVAMIVLGAAILFGGFGELGRTASVANLWRHGGFAPNGLVALLLAFPIALFSFGGVEVVGVTAGEAEDPARTMPRAIRGIVYRIVLFYLGALTIILCLLPWNELSTRGSPFVLVFEQIGIPAAADVINFVVITAAASACSTGIFTAGRMLHTLAQLGRAPRSFGEVSAQHIPARGVAVSSLLMLCGVVLNYFVPEQAFGYVMSVVVVVQVWAWGVILAANLRYRKAVAAGTKTASSFQMPWAPYSNYLVLGVLGLVYVLLGIDADTRVAIYATPLWFGL
ncbi:MAG: amino acid permease-associated region, partial [Rhodospirillales bacterium]|nr:amino acid permease-associated region [Rhodospirillales bacterium]